MFTEERSQENVLPSPDEGVTGSREVCDFTQSLPTSCPVPEVMSRLQAGSPPGDIPGLSSPQVYDCEDADDAGEGVLSPEERREAMAEVEYVPSGGDDVAAVDWLANSVKAQGKPAGLTSPLEADANRIRKSAGRQKPKTLAKPEIQPVRHVYSPEQRILLIDTWRRSALPVKQFAPLVGLSPHTLYKWNSDFEKFGPEGLMDHKRGVEKGSRLPEVTKRMILMLKEENPEYGCQRISDLLARGPGVPASASAVALFLKESGYECEETPTEPHTDHKRRFERSRPGSLWQTDIFTFTLRRQNRRVHMVGFMDDHSRFLTGYAIHGMGSTDMVIETLRVAVAAFGAPEELLTDNGPQYCTWRGVSRFTKECAKLGIRQIVSRPRHPQTLGKIERFWGTLWRDFLKSAIFLDLEDVRRRVGLFIDHYNFQRPHQSLEGLAPAERFFGVAPEVLASMKARLQDNALEIARKGFPRKPFYLAGQIDGKQVSLHEENGRVFMVGDGGTRQEVELVTPYGLDEQEKADALSEVTPQCPDGSPPEPQSWKERPEGGNTTWESGMSALADSLEKSDAEENHDQ